ncbi:MAG: redoxin domain-containing protein [Phycisphaeraceae bacterium]|nr:MAG: redoxin domain-containing protein [Phycisphaeraceae bacterium]
MSRTSRIVSASVLAAAAFVAAATPGLVSAQPGSKQDGKKAAEGPTIGSIAPAFALRDLDGKEHTLAQLTKDGHVVVLVWFNADCPYVKKHFGDNKTFNDMQTKFKGQKVTMLFINSNAPGTQGSGKDRNVKARDEWKIDWPILLDEAGTVGKAYGSKNTPATYVIGTDGTLKYAGAIDDDASPNKVGKTNYAVKAVEELLAGKPVTTTTTAAYGCSVKYKN